MKILSKVLVILFFLLFSLFLTASLSLAQTKNAQASAHPVATENVAGTFQSETDYIPNNLHNWTQNVMIEVMSALTCQISGVDPTNPKQSCLGVDSASGKIGFLPSPQSGGAIGAMGNMITMLYTPPLHTADYFKDLASNFGISKKTYAQTTGTGFDSLSPLINIWSAFRNIVYLLLVIVFVVIGLAIMLRIKIDPRTVMTIQNQIPKIIVGILAVTFSFAIAGFLIDVMWLLIYLIYNVIAGIHVGNIAGLNPVQMQNSNPFGALGGGGVLSIAWNAAFGVGEFLSSLLSGKMGAAGGIILVGGLSALTFFINPFVGAIATVLGLTGGAAAGGAALGAIGGFIAFFIILIALLVALFRLWFTLLMAYVQILLAVVLGPFWIIGGIVPGSQVSLGGWLKDIGANLLAFPVIIGMFLLGRVFMDVFGKTPAAGQNFVPPLVGNPGDPSLIGSLIALGILLMTPNVVTMLKAAIKAPKTDTGLGKALGVGAGVPMAGLRTVGAAVAKTPNMGERGGFWGAIRNIGKF